MSYTDLLKGRHSEPQRIYFITTVTYQRQPVFTDLYCARQLIKILQHMDSSQNTSTLAWVAMPDHLHWLFQLGDNSSLARLMNNIKGRSAYEINKYMGVSGRFWQKQYYDHAIRKTESIKQIACYIVANPLRAGLVDNIANYPHWDAAWL